jgi:biopolymer transport protein ExbD
MNSRFKRRASEGHGDETGIDLAPMLDFVLNLLIFFIITAVFVKEVGITVSRPNAATAEKKEAGNILIAVRADGEIWIDKRAVDLRAVRANIERLHAQRPDDAVVVRAWVKRGKSCDHKLMRRTATKPVSTLHRCSISC